MIYQVTCRCGTAFKVDERAIDRSVKCAGCGEKFLIEADNLEPVTSYRLTCECGARFRVEEKAVGGSFRCPGCRRTVHITRESLLIAESEYERVSKRPQPSLPVDFEGNDPDSGDSSVHSAGIRSEALEDTA
jgi:DNA-directed RNA polymerase subunit RPC12/RpoP